VLSVLDGMCCVCWMECAVCAGWNVLFVLVPCRDVAPRRSVTCFLLSVLATTSILREGFL
jgi:hypothetical protein